MMLSAEDLTALWLTVKLALLTTILLMVGGAPLAWWLASGRRTFLKTATEAIVALPMVLPPTVLGFYLLVLMGRQGPLGQLVESLGGAAPAFTFTGLVIGSMAYSLPFVVQPLQQAFRSIKPRHLETAATLRASRWDRFFSIILPMSRGGILTAAVLGFAHTLGEFGVVLMIGGNIPGETRVLSIAIYSHVEAMDYQAAHTLSALLLVASFLMLLPVYAMSRRSRPELL